MHYRRELKHGHPQVDKPVRKVTGKGHLSHGYYKVAVPRELRWLTNGVGSMTEHRLVMAMMLGRPLFPDESVHHVNGDRLDNREANLQLWSRWQPSGQRVEDKVRYAVELLQRYAPELLAAASNDSSQSANSNA